MSEETPIKPKKSARAFILPLLLPALGLLALLSWGVESVLSPGISLAAYGAAIGVAGIMVGATLYLIHKTGFSEG